MNIKTPFYEGEFYPSYGTPIGTPAFRLYKIRKRCMKLKISLNACCGKDAIIEPFLNGEKTIVFDKLANKILANEVYFHAYVSWLGNAYEYIYYLNTLGLSCVFSGKKNDPIIIIPDFFDKEFYKNIE